MSENLYAPPRSEPPPRAPDLEEVPPFYIVAPRKFWILLLSTAGLYQLYWFYRHWKAQKAVTGERMWPIMRSLFVIFFTHSLFSRIDAANASAKRPLSLVATLFVVLTLADTMVSRLAQQDIGSPWTDLLELLLIPVLGFLLGKAQNQANLACGDPEGSFNDDLSAANAVWIVLGLLLWCLIVFGLLSYTGLITIQA